MVVESETPEIHAARKTSLELLLGEHLGDCVGPCQPICPANMDIPQMIRHIAEGRMAEAVAVVKERIPIPAILGRICPELCEKGCRRGQVDAPVAIKLLKRYVGDWDLASATPYKPECAAPTGKHVAIIGAGPAGISAAYYLRIDGHAVSIFDERERVGGMLRYGVPQDMLPHEVIDAEFANIVATGIEIHQGTHVGRDVNMDDLRRDFDAVIVAAGQISPEVADELGLPATEKGPQVDRQTMMSPTAGVFVAGATFAPSKHAVRSVASGRRVAICVTQYLAGGEIMPPEPLYTVRMGRLSPAEVAEFSEGASTDARVMPAGFEPSQRSEKPGFTAEEAAIAAQRCLQCDCAALHTCRLRTWAMKYGANPNAYRGERKHYTRETGHPQLVYEAGKCISCGLCVQIAQDAGEHAGLSFIGRGFDVRVGVPFDDPLETGLTKVASECAAACPTAALTWVGENGAPGEHTDKIKPMTDI